MSPRVLNIGLVGGGGNAFIAHPHQRAIHQNGDMRVTCAALRSNPEKSLEDARNWPYPIKAYGSYKELIAEEAKKPVGERVDYVLIVTPNHAHFDPALKCLESGIPVYCEKPLTLTLEESRKLVEVAKEKNIPFAVAHTYIGHWTSRLSPAILCSRDYWEKFAGWILATFKGGFPKN